MQELIKIIPMLPVKDDKHVINIISRSGSDFQIEADKNAEINSMRLSNFTIESPTLKKLGVGAGETVYIAKNEGTDEASGPYRVEYDAPAKLATESVKEGRGATPNFSIQR